MFSPHLVRVFPPMTPSTCCSSQCGPPVQRFAHHCARVSCVSPKCHCCFQVASWKPDTSTFFPFCSASESGFPFFQKCLPVNKRWVVPSPRSCWPRCFFPFCPSLLIPWCAPLCHHTPAWLRTGSAGVSSLGPAPSSAPPVGARMLCKKIPCDLSNLSVWVAKS